MRDEDPNEPLPEEDTGFSRIRPLFDAVALITELRRRAEAHAPKTPEEIEESHAKWEVARATQYRRYGWTKPRR